MSRTRKDRPLQVKIEEHKAKTGLAYDEDCIVCLRPEEYVKTHDFTVGGIFFAHEVQEQEAFIKTAEELGFTVKRKESYGYLGFTAREALFRAYLHRYHKLPKELDQLEALLSPGRLILDQPISKFEFLSYLPPHYGEFLFKNNEANNLHPQHKGNVFVILSASKTYEDTNSYHWHTPPFEDIESLRGSYSCSCCRVHHYPKAEKRRERDYGKKLVNQIRRTTTEDIIEEFEDMGLERPNNMSFASKFYKKF